MMNKISKIAMVDSIDDIHMYISKLMSEKIRENDKGLFYCLSCKEEAIEPHLIVHQKHCRIKNNLVMIKMLSNKKFDVIDCLNGSK